MSPSPIQLLIVGAIVILLFGARRFSDLGKGLGEGIRNFKKGISDEDLESSKDDSKGEAKKASKKSGDDSDEGKSSGSKSSGSKSSDA